ncbi:MAG: hypothetical protein HYU58_08990 [Proteobacteria bacterium]|nr:hypothetical protein [Pseudomonadota bacterium]
MRLFRWLSLATPLLAAPIVGCADIDMSFLPKTSSAVVTQMEIGPKTWAAYQQYLAAISPDRHGVFAIATDGQGGESWICNTAACVDDGQFAIKAIERCQASNPGYRCMVFDVDRVPQIAFSPPS